MDTKSKSTIYVAIPVGEKGECNCPHCKAEIIITKKTSIVECPSCSNYMHVVFVTKNSPDENV